MSFRGTTTRGGFTVRVLKGNKGLGPTHERALEELLTTKRGRLSNADGCAIVFFRSKGDLVAVQRCDHRHLKAHNRKQCVAKKGPNKGRFVKCR